LDAYTMDGNSGTALEAPAGWAAVRVKSGFTAAERETLYGEFQPLVQRLVRQYGDDAELAQDLPGEIYCRFCALLEEFDPARGVPLRAYLVRGLSLSTYSFARSQWRRRRREPIIDPDITTSLSTWDPTDGWDRDLMTRRVLNALPAAIERLPRRQKYVVTGRFYEARSFEEMASSMGVAPATARSLLRHGLANIRRQLARSGVTWE
jgi:RNA polymerase sigma factor (sigma-70 family)